MIPKELRALFLKRCHSKVLSWNLGERCNDRTAAETAVRREYGPAQNSSMFYFTARVKRFVSNSDVGSSHRCLGARISFMDLGLIEAPTRDFLMARMLALERRMGHPRVPTSRSFASCDTVGSTRILGSRGHPSYFFCFGDRPSPRIPPDSSRSRHVPMYSSRRDRAADKS